MTPTPAPAPRATFPGTFTLVALALGLGLACSRPTTHPSGRPLPSRGLPYTEEGMASWYGGGGDGFAGKPTANGEAFDPSQATCAHRTLPLGCLVEVENLENHRRVVLRVNDRGPYAKGRILDASRRGAQELGYLGQGTARVRIRTVDTQGRPTPLDPSIDVANPYTVQVAALSNMNIIHKLKNKISTGFGPITLQEAPPRNGLSVKRLRVGSYTNRQDAERAAERLTQLLKDDRVEPFVTRQH